MTTPSQEYCLIPLTQGQFAKISPHRFEEISKRTWHAYWNPRKKYFYAKTNLRSSDGMKGVVFMHRLILGIEYRAKVVVDHINGDSLDNRDENLRVCIASENAKNRKNQCSNKSGFKGVSKKSTNGCTYWTSRISCDGRTIHLGLFPYTDAGLIEAARRYDEAAMQHHGTFANLNFFPHI